jgi:hypothetical protein
MYYGRASLQAPLAEPAFVPYMAKGASRRRPSSAHPPPARRPQQPHGGDLLGPRGSEGSGRCGGRSGPRAAASQLMPHPDATACVQVTVRGNLAQLGGGAGRGAVLAQDREVPALW